MYIMDRESKSWIYVLLCR